MRNPAEGEELSVIRREEASKGRSGPHAVGAVRRKICTLGRGQHASGKREKHVKFSGFTGTSDTSTGAMSGKSHCSRPVNFNNLYLKG